MLFKNAVHIKNYTNLLETSAQFSAHGSSFLRGTMMPSVQTIDLLVKEYGIQPDDVDALWRALTRSESGHTRGSWAGTFKRLVLNPVQTVSGQPACCAWLRFLLERSDTSRAILRVVHAQVAEEKWGFQDILHWCESFHLLQYVPIDHGHAQAVQRAMSASGAVFDEEALVEYGLPACSCRWYVHYCVCDHAIALMLQQGTLLKIPPKLDPARTQRASLARISCKKGATGSHVGRIAKSREGGARDFDDSPSGRTAKKGKGKKGKSKRARAPRKA
jgi:hypothetical protein